MKITSIETFSTRLITIVRVKNDEGYEGYGQIATYHANLSALVLHQQVAPHALGKDHQDIDGLIDYIVTQEHKFPGSHLCRAVGGLDTALWDLRGKMEQKSVCELLGGTPGELRVYGSSMSREIKPEDEAERLVRLQDSHGFTAFKIRIANNFGNDVDKWPGRTEAIVPAVRKAIGDDTALMVDANSGYTPKKAIEVGRMLEQYNVAHFEEPCPYPELEWTAEVAAALDVPVAGGEQDTDLAHFQRMINMKAVDIVQPDVLYIGGISRALKVAKMAEKAGIPCTPHAANMSMVTLFTAHFLKAINSAGPYLEYSIEDTEWTKNLYDPVLEVKDGKVVVSDEPGWGVRINPEWLEKAEYKISELDA